MPIRKIKDTITSRGKDKKGRGDTYLLPESSEMYAELRELIQSKIRGIARVNALKNREEQRASHEAGMEEQVYDLFEKHPYLDKQPLDGIDPSLSVNSQAYRKWEKAQKDQNEKKRERALELQKQLNPDLTPTFTPNPKFNPKPKGP